MKVSKCVKEESERASVGDEGVSEGNGRGSEGAKVQREQVKRVRK